MRTSSNPVSSRHVASQQVVRPQRLAAHEVVSVSARGSLPHRATYQLADGPSSATFFAARGGLTGPAPSLNSSQPPLPRDKPRLIYVGPSNPAPHKGLPQLPWAPRRSTLLPPPLSLTDEHFRQLGLEFVETRRGIVVTELNELFVRVGFPRRDPAKLAVALEKTHALVWVRATQTTRLARAGQMVGFARATSDGTVSATIWDVSVLPAWQRAGLGRAMMERLTRRLVEGGIPTITLYAEPNVVGLYEKLGFSLAQELQPPSASPPHPLLQQSAQQQAQPQPQQGARGGADRELVATAS